MITLGYSDAIDYSNPINRSWGLNRGLIRRWMPIAQKRGGRSVRELVTGSHTLMSTSTDVPRMWGRRAKAFSFDGAENIGASTGFGVQGDLTIFVAFKIDSVTGGVGDGMLFPAPSFNSGEMRTGIVTVGGPKLRYDHWASGTTTKTVSLITLTLGQLYTAAFTNKVGALTGYLNGVFDVSNTSGFSSSSYSPIMIGGVGSGTITGGNGSLYDLRVYNRALSAQDINLLHIDYMLGSPFSLNRISPMYLDAIMEAGGIEHLLESLSGTNSAQELTQKLTVFGGFDVGSITVSDKKCIVNQFGEAISSTKSAKSVSATLRTSDASFPLGWSHYWEATPVNPTGTNLTGILMVLDLSRLSGLGSIANISGSDIRVSTTGNSKLACDLMPWYNNGSGLLLFNPGTKTTSTTGYRVWAGNPYVEMPAVDSTWGQYNTYSTGIQGFYPSGAGLDRTSNQRHLIMLDAPTTTGAGPYSGTIGTSYNGTTNYGTGSITSINSYPLSLSAWLYANTDVGAIPLALMVSNNASRYSAAIRLSSNVGQAAVANAGTVVAASSSGTYSSGIWFNMHASFGSTTNRVAYRDGTNGVISTTSQNLVAPVKVSIGAARDNNSSNDPFDGFISMARLYNRPLIDQEANYDNRMRVQDEFWGTWTQTALEDTGGGGFTTHELQTIFNSLTSELFRSSISMPSIMSDGSRTNERLYSSLRNLEYLADGTRTAQFTNARINFPASVKDGSTTAEDITNRLNIIPQVFDGSLTRGFNIATATWRPGLIDGSVTAENLYSNANMSADMIDGSKTVSKYNNAMAILQTLIDGTVSRETISSIITANAKVFDGTQTAEDVLSKLNFNISTKDGTISAERCFLLLNMLSRVIDVSRTGEVLNLDTIVELLLSTISFSKTTQTAQNNLIISSTVKDGTLTNEQMGAISTLLTKATDSSLTGDVFAAVMEVFSQVDVETIIAIKTVSNLYCRVTENAIAIDSSKTQAINYLNLRILNATNDGSLTQQQIRAIATFIGRTNDGTLTAESVNATMEVFSQVDVQIIDAIKTASNMYCRVTESSRVIDNSKTQQQNYLKLIFSLNDVDRSSSGEIITPYLLANAFIKDGTISKEHIRSMLLSAIQTNDGTNTRILNRAVINSLLYSILAVYTRDIYDLNLQTFTAVEIATICSILSRSEAYVGLTLHCSVTSPNKTGGTSYLSRLQSIQTVLEARTAQLGATISNLGLLTESSTTNTAIFQFNLNSPLGTLDGTLTALLGELSSGPLTVPDNGEEVLILVYINMEDSHNLHINRENLSDTHINRQRHINLQI